MHFSNRISASLYFPCKSESQMNDCRTIQNQSRIPKRRFESANRNKQSAWNGICSATFSRSVSASTNKFLEIKNFAYIRSLAKSPGVILSSKSSPSPNAENLFEATY